MTKRIGQVVTVFLFTIGVIGAGSAAAGPVTFDFTGTQGGSTGEGSIGNTRTFTSNGVTVTASAWSYTYDLAPGTDNALGAAALGRWSSGLGVCNSTEFPCSSPGHQVDNVGVDDWVLFVFSTPVDVSSVRIDPYGNFDRDVSYYVRSASTPFSLTGASYTGLSGLGFSSLYSSEATASDAYRDVSISGGAITALLFGGYKGGTDQDDYFKITSLAGQTIASVPEPTTLLLSMSGMACLAASRLRRRRQLRSNS